MRKSGWRRTALLCVLAAGALGVYAGPAAANPHFAVTTCNTDITLANTVAVLASDLVCTGSDAINVCANGVTVTAGRTTRSGTRPS